MIESRDVRTRALLERKNVVETLRFEQVFRDAFPAADALIAELPAELKTRIREKML